MRQIPRLLLALCVGAGAAVAQVAPAAPPPADAERAADEATLSPGRLARALSLDLRGTLPTDDEAARVEAAGAVPDDLLDAWLASPAFAEQVVRFHRGLLWNNVENVRLLAVNSTLQFDRGEGVWWRRNPARVYRGDDVPCRGEPAAWDADGRLEVDADGREGYVEVAPYWAPDTPMRVCGFDAQDARASTLGTDCATTAGSTDPGCGCGPELRWCTAQNVDREVNRAMAAALDRLIFELIAADAPYTELFTSRRAWVNGPLTYFYRHHLGLPRGLSLEPAPVDPADLPELDWTDADAWTEIRLNPAHAGILTRPAFLLRFQTNRARANRFYDAFLCQPFNPPDGGLPVADEAEARNPDLQLRAGCKYCHALLEPAAAHWGRWAEQGIGYLAPDDFPVQRDDCTQCALRGVGCSRECRTFYVTQALAPEEAPFQGMLNAYQFRRDAHLRNIEQGPRLLALQGLADDRLPACVTRRAAEWLLGRPLDQPGDAAWLAARSRDFVQADYSYRSLVRSIVTDGRYGRVR